MDQLGLKWVEGPVDEQKRQSWFNSHWKKQIQEWSRPSSHSDVTDLCVGLSCRLYWRTFSMLVTRLVNRNQLQHAETETVGTRTLSTEIYINWMMIQTTSKGFSIYLLLKKFTGLFCRITQSENVYWANRFFYCFLWDQVQVFCWDASKNKTNPRLCRWKISDKKKHCHLLSSHFTQFPWNMGHATRCLSRMIVMHQQKQWNHPSWKGIICGSAPGF